MTRLLEAFGMPRSRLGRELALVLVIKLTIIGLAAVFIFGPDQRPRIDAAKVEAHLLGTPPSSSLLTTAVSEIVISKTAISKTAISKSAAARSKIP